MARNLHNSALQTHYLIRAFLHPVNRFYSKAILPALLKLALLPLLLGYTFDTYAQCVLICNQGIQVSLDPAGQAQISTQLITPNAANSCPGSLQLTLFNAQGQAIPNPLTCDYVGETITAEVKHIASGNFCTGDLTLVDALPPVLNCPDKFIFATKIRIRQRLACQRQATIALDQITWTLPILILRLLWAVAIFKMAYRCSSASTGPGL